MEHRYGFALLFLAHTVAQAEPRNVILMIADGAGYNTWAATAMYEGSQSELYDSPEWVRLAVSTHPLRLSEQVPVGPEHGLTQLPSLVYDPVRAWDPSPAPGEKGGYPYSFAGYEWLLQASDSANTATALVTGQKTFVGAINTDGNGAAIERTLAALAHDAGLRVGAVTSVLFNDATAAVGAGAHSRSRKNLCELAWEILTRPGLDLIAGCCHPDFDNNGRRIDDPARRSFLAVGDEPIWNALTGAKTLDPGTGVCSASGSALKATREQIDALTSWTRVHSKAGVLELLGRRAAAGRLLIIPEVGGLTYQDGRAEDPALLYDHPIGGTLQQQRGSRADARFTGPGDDPLIESVPTLETLTKVALKHLGESPEGFFLHVEGGAVDWAMHANQTGRMIEEMQDFERAIRAVIEWVEAGAGWEHTLLVVTSDHDHLLWGPDSERIPFQPLISNGRGKLPAHRWLSDGHTNQLVPVFARGRGARNLERYATRDDPFRGRYLDQTDIFRVMSAELAR